MCQKSAWAEAHPTAPEFEILCILSKFLATFASWRFREVSLTVAESLVYAVEGESEKLIAMAIARMALA